MGKKQREKNIIILIEGPSERTVFGIAIPEMYESIGADYNVHFALLYEDCEEIRGDITSKFGVTPETIEGLISKLYIGRVLEEKKFYARDISEIIHIIDLDGAYIPDDNIVQGDNPNNVDRPFYTENSIINQSVQNIVDRNARKRANIDALLSLPQGKIKVWHNPDNPKSKQSLVPYSLYYFSSNMDHFIHHDANLPNSQDKFHLAEIFRNGFIDNTADYVSFFTGDPDAAGDMSYEESWTFIREPGLNSLARHTNIDLLFKRLQSLVNEE